ncbi:sugar-binding transcriptional regulator [uncultured Maritimibacter sp.]|jgi:DNA-binding transcriptional regulator LsrR (DeoR family)|uniref:sugar-binding transcriptional regulator n=1 Tax=uncultured Maritimibacter sp. TaxID=991866 RepID=UPI000A4074C4|nr:sugar-binding transcriptional regulator [uncultured Maritimibacter sp.]
MNSMDRKLDDAARAAWLAYVGGRKQDEIAQIMGISRQSAQRLVSQAQAAGLVKVSIDHPISRCMFLAEELRRTYGIDFAEVVPSLGTPADSNLAVATATGARIERWLDEAAPQIIGLGTGRTLRAAIECLPHIDCAQHRVVSLTGNIAPDGSTAHYNVLFTITDKVTASTYPMPMPVISASPEERAAVLGQKTLATARDLAEKTDVRFVGVGSITRDAPLFLDGFIERADQERLVEKGAVGEIVGWVFDAEGRLVDDVINQRVSSAPLEVNTATPIIASANGPDKVAAIRGAMVGQLINGLITDEDTALALTA